MTNILKAMTVLGLVSLTSCASQGSLASDSLKSRLAPLSVRAPIAPHPIELSNELKTANYGDIVFEQNFYPAFVYRLETGISQKHNLAGLKVGKLDIPADTPVYAVNTRLTGRTACVARAIEKNSSVAEKIFLGSTIGTAEARKQGTRYCLTDKDNDGTFDDVRAMIDSADFMIQGGYIAKNSTQLDPKITYKKVHRRSGPVQRIGFEARAPGFIAGGASLEAMGIQGERRVPFSKEWLGAGKKKNLPKVITYRGAEIEVTDYDDDTITYRVLSGFTISSLDLFTQIELK